MLARIIQVRPQFNEYILEETTKKRTIDGMSLDVIERIVKLLKNFYDLTKVISSDR